MYQKFWEQVVDWAMRPAETGPAGDATEYRDGKIRVTVDARDEKDRPLARPDPRGKVTAPGRPQPGEKPPTLEFVRNGAGRYEAEFPAEEAGSYFVRPCRRSAGRPGGRTAAGAASTVPYSPEFADLESNTPLLERLADATGGQVYDETTPSWRRAAPAGDGLPGLPHDRAGVAAVLVLAGVRRRGAACCSTWPSAA